MRPVAARQIFEMTAFIILPTCWRLLSGCRSLWRRPVIPQCRRPTSTLSAASSRLVALSAGVSAHQRPELAFTFTPHRRNTQLAQQWHAGACALEEITRHVMPLTSTEYFTKYRALFRFLGFTIAATVSEPIAAMPRFRASRGRAIMPAAVSVICLKIL